jgi:hypothetical protein
LLSQIKTDPISTSPALLPSTFLPTIDIPKMTVDEATQTNGVPEPQAGQLKQEETEKSRWTVESGMS